MAEEKKDPAKPETKHETKNPGPAKNPEPAVNTGHATIRVEQEKQELLAKSEISLWLDHYDDIFSDFDPRPYSERALSDDFIREARKAVREKKSGKIELRFLIPESLREAQTETVIRKRIKGHFKDEAAELKKEQKSVIKWGGIAVFIGFILMMITTFIYNSDTENFLLQFLVVIFEPAGWFSTWYGLDQIFYVVKQKKPEIKFNDDVAKAEISFESY